MVGGCSLHYRFIRNDSSNFDFMCVQCLATTTVRVPFPLSTPTGIELGNSGLRKCEIPVPGNTHDKQTMSPNFGKESQRCSEVRSPRYRLPQYLPEHNIAMNLARKR